MNLDLGVYQNYVDWTLIPRVFFFPLNRGIEGGAVAEESPLPL